MCSPADGRWYLHHITVYYQPDSFRMQALRVLYAYALINTPLSIDESIGTMSLDLVLINLIVRLSIRHYGSLTIIALSNRQLDCITLFTRVLLSNNERIISL